MFNQTNTVRAEILKRESQLSLTTPNPPLLEKRRSQKDTVRQSGSSESDNTDGSDSTHSDIALEILHLRELVTFLDEEFGSQSLKMDILLQKKSITFDLLWHLFPAGSEIGFKDCSSDLPCAGKVYLANLMHVSYLRSQVLPMKLGMGVRVGPVFRFGCSILTTISMDSTTGLSSCKLPSFVADASNIPFFRDSRELSSLPAEPLDRVTKEEFKARGQEFIELRGQHYLTKGS